MCRIGEGQGLAGYYTILTRMFAVLLLLDVHGKEEIVVRG
jgi:hypothetical protein